MTAYKSKAEQRRAEWLSRQYAADRASSLDTFVAEQAAASKKKHAHAARLAALKAAVVEAAMKYYYGAARDNTRDTAKLLAQRLAVFDACAALAAITHNE